MPLMKKNANLVDSTPLTGQQKNCYAGRLLRKSGRGRIPIAEVLEDRRLLASVIVVSDATIIEDGEVQARDFGYEQVGESVRTREFVIANTGANPVTLSDLQLPEGFRIAENIVDTTLSSGDVTTFSISLDPTASAGEKSGDVVFLATDDEGTQTFNFAIDGTLTPAGGPRIVGFYPDVSGGFWADFDEALDPATITSETVTVFTAGDDGELNTDDDQAITGTIDYVTDRREIRFIPDLQISEDYRVELRGSGNGALITALGGETLDGDYFSSLPSGNGSSGGSFHTRVNVSERTNISRFDTVVGLIDVQLTPDVTPITVQNFYDYSDAGDWDGSFIHRSVPGFIVQGGGFYYENGIAHSIDEHAPIENEFQEGVTTNTRGTIAMAKLGGDPDSATNQWFFNLVDNSDNLDNQNGGFTTFGTIIGPAGLETIDHIASLDTVNAGGAFTNLPLRDTAAAIDNDNLLVVTRVAALASFEPLTQGPVWDVVINDGSDSSAAAYTFADVSPGELISQSFLVVNRGTEAVTINSIAGLISPFSVTPSNNSGEGGDDWILQPADTFEFTITFNSSISGLFTDSLLLTSTAGTPGTFTVDLTASAVPLTTSGVSLDPSSDTGQSSTDNITRLNNNGVDNRLVFNITGVEENATVTVYANETAIGSAVVPVGQTSVAVTTNGTSPLIDGDIVITAKQMRGGAESNASDPLVITVDSIGPDIEGADNRSVTQGDSVVIDLNSTDETNGLHPVYTADSIPDGAVLDSTTGVITWTPTAEQVDINQFNVTLTDVAGNSSSASFNVTVKPLAPTSVDLTNASDTGSSASDNITHFNNADSDNTMAFRVDGVAPEATVRIFAGGTLIGNAIVPLGENSVLVITDGSTPLADDTYSITAVQIRNGLTSNASGALTLTIDTVAPVLDPVGNFTISVGQLFTIDLNTDDEQAQRPTTYSLTNAPTGATINPTTGVINWTPLDSQIGTVLFSAAAVDVAGNIASDDFEIDVLGTSLGEDGISFSGTLAGRKSHVEFLVQPEMTGEFVIEMAEAIPAAKISIIDTRTGKAVTKPGSTKSSIPAALTFHGEAGVTYEIKVKAKGNASGDFTLNVIYDEDGRILDAHQLTEEFVDLGDEGTASTFSSNGAVDPRLDRDFFTFTPSAGGDTSFAVTTTGELHAEIILFRVSADSTLSRIKKARDNKGTGTSGFATSLEAGTQYAIQVTSIKGKTSGLYNLNVEVDSNSSFNSPALQGDLDDSLLAEGTILQPKDIDWFSFTPTFNGAVLYDTDHFAGQKLKLTFVDAVSGQVISRSTGKHGSLPFGRFETTAGREVRMLVQAKGKSSGDYSINIRMDDLGSAAQSQTLDLQLQPSGSELDPLVTTFQGEISSNLDQDFYTFTAPANATSAYFNVYADNSSLLSDVTIYSQTDSGLHKISKFKDKGSGSSLRISIDPGGIYYLAIESFKGNSAGAYNVNVEIDGNSSFTTADSLGTISSQASISGVILGARDIDYFSFIAGEGNTLILSDFIADNGLTGQITLYSADNLSNPIAKSKGRTSDQLLLETTIVAGQQYFLVMQGTGKTNGGYSFNLELT